MAIRTANKEFISRWVQANPHSPGPAEAWIRGYAVSVWVLINQLQLDYGTAEADPERVERLAADYALPPEAVEAALAYYRRHKELIDARIALSRSEAAS